MTKWWQSLSRCSDRRLYTAVLVLTAPAFLLHLGMMAFIGDEGIRSLVALEMVLSGNYLTPTLNGAAYFNKPPLYNWVLILTAKLWGGFGEWPARLTTLVFLFGFAWLVYTSTRRHFDRRFAFTAAFMVLTSGRILFWDAMLGLIDIAFSAVVYANFMLLYHQGAAGKWRRMFVGSYLLFAAAFLLKGMPAVVFQAVSVPVALYLHTGGIRRLLSREHFIGIAAGLLPVLTYYGLYAGQQSLSTAFSVLLDQSMQRTATHHGWQKTVLHVFTFPFEQVYHFLPWSLLILLFFHPKFWRWTQEQPFVRFNFWMLAANLPVYWLSVEVYPRYLLMFIPLFNLVGFYALQRSLEERRVWWRVLNGFFMVLACASALAFLAMPLVERTHELPWLLPVWLAGSLLLIVIALGLATDGKRMFVWLVLVLLVVRIGFNAVILPFRRVDDRAYYTRADAGRLARKWGDRTWYIWGETETHQVARFYTANALQQIVRKTNEIRDSSAIYLVDPEIYPDFPGYRVDSLRLESGTALPLMRLNY